MYKEPTEREALGYSNTQPLPSYDAVRTVIETGHNEEMDDSMSLVPHKRFVRESEFCFTSHHFPPRHLDLVELFRGG